MPYRSEPRTVQQVTVVILGGYMFRGTRPDQKSTMFTDFDQINMTAAEARIGRNGES